MLVKQKKQKLQAHPEFLERVDEELDKGNSEIVEFIPGNSEIVEFIPGNSEIAEFIPGNSEIVEIIPGR